MMSYLFVAFILLFCVPAVFIPSARLPLMMGTAAVAVALGAVSLIWANTVAPGYVASHPALAATPLQAGLANVFGGILFLYGVGLFLAIGVRHLLILSKMIAPR